jgi:predicted small secreted protein
VTKRSCLALVAAALLASGCRNTADGAREDARKAAKEAEQAAQDAKRELDRAARDAQRAVQDARKEVREGLGEARDSVRGARSTVQEAGRDVREAGRDMQDAASEIHGAKQLVDVRAALALSKEISSGSDISVRSDEAGRTVILTGTVPSAAERAAAERIARESASGLRVENRLKVAPAR